jgi:hypothetical protein
MALHDILDQEANKALIDQVEQAPLPPPGSMLRRRYDLAKGQLSKGASERAQDSVSGTHRVAKPGGGSELHRSTLDAALAAGSRGHVAARTAEDRLGARSARGMKPNFDPRNPAVSSDYYDEEAACQILNSELASSMQRTGAEKALAGLKDLGVVKAVERDPLMREALARAKAKANAKGRKPDASDISRELLRLKAENLEPDAEMAAKKKSKKGKRGLLSKSAGRITVDVPEGGIIVRPGR